MENNDTKSMAQRIKERNINKDNVNHPSHYNQGGIECIDAIEAATTNLKGIESFCTGNAIKYLFRWKEKNGAEDLKKAKWYIDRLISENKDKLPKDEDSDEKSTLTDEEMELFREYGWVYRSR